jgi:hypothetical protein
MKTWVAGIGIAIIIGAIIVGVTLWTIPNCPSLNSICTPAPVASITAYPFEFIIAMLVGIVVTIFGITKK